MKIQKQVRSGNTAKEVSGMGKEEVQKNYTVSSIDGMGQVQISNEVVTIIAGLAISPTNW